MEAEILEIRTGADAVSIYYATTSGAKRLPNCPATCSFVCARPTLG